MSVRPFDQVHGQGRAFAGEGAGAVARPEPAPRGLRVFTAGHSFHVFVAPLLAELARSAGIAGHALAGTQFLGGSRVLEHWERPDAANDAKRALRGGRVDVLTLSPTFHPDPGTTRFGHDRRRPLSITLDPRRGTNDHAAHRAKSGRHALGPPTDCTSPGGRAPVAGSALV